MVQKTVTICYAVFIVIQYQRVTDGRTDGLTLLLSISRVTVLTRDKNIKNFVRPIIES